MKIEDLTQRIAQQLAQWQLSQENQTNGYEYKKSFADLWQKLGQEVFQSSLGEAKYSKNSKQVKTKWGEVIVAKAHPLAACLNGFRISRHLQEVISYLGSDYVFEEASGLLIKLLGVDYGFYRQKKLLIGSRAIESAHREVIQCRLNPSGQRWSKAGAQQIVQLRVAKKSNRWNKVISIAQHSKIAA